MLRFATLFVLASIPFVGHAASSVLSLHAPDLAEAREDTPPRDTVVVFVAWGHSNSGNPGKPGYGSPPNQQPASPTVRSNVAKEWFAWGTPPARVRTLLSPVPTLNSANVQGDGGSWWPQIALTYNDATQRVIFMSSAAEGATSSTWLPPNGRNYRSGLTTIDRAMAEARAHFNNNTVVVFGGVLWNLGPGLRPGDTYPWDGYRADLHTLLLSFGADVIDRWGGRFYFVNTAIPGPDAYPNPETDYGMDLEADVCSAYAYCSMIQESVFVKLAEVDCMNDPGATSLCGGWYSPNKQTGEAGPHWGQAALNHMGRRIGEVMAAAGVAGRFGGHSGPEVSVEIPLPIEYPRTESPPRILVEIRKSDGSLATDPFEVTPTIASPDWTADLNGDAPDSDWTLEGWDALDTQSLTFQVYRVRPGHAAELIASHVYAPAAEAGAQSTDRVLPDVRFEVSPDGSVATRRLGHADAAHEPTIQAASAAVPATHGGALLDVGEVQPNPTPSSATMPFTLGAEATVEATLYDVLGRRVAVLASGSYGPGRHAVTFNGASLPRGVFVVRITARGASGSSTAVKRITLTR